MRGVSTIVASILVLMISASLVSVSYVFLTDVSGNITDTGRQTAQKAFRIMGADMKVETVSGNRIYVRNTGSVNLSRFTVYVNDVVVDIISVEPEIVEPSKTVTITTSSPPIEEIKVYSYEFGPAEYYLPIIKCPDTICNVTGGECDSCDLDCDISDCCGNGVCNSIVGEDFSTCPGDCSSFCGDYICNVFAGECETCYDDCTFEECCGNGICNSGEDFSICPADCSPLCGDGSIQGGEVCDDGNTNNCDGCIGDCSRADDVCGDGITECGESCDDNNNGDCDGCRGDCSRIDAFCGDNIAECGEECDGTDDSACSGSCLGDCSCGAPPPACGDGNVDAGEICDDGNTVSCDGCRRDCSRWDDVCGDGIRECGEACDDGNTVSCDGCRADCSRTEYCGNNIAECGEECDGTDDGACSGPCENDCTCGLYIPPPIGFWHFNNQVPGAAVDYSGNDLHGSFIGSPNYVSRGSGYALNFNGVNEYVLVPHDNLLDIRNEITISALFYIRDLNSGYATYKLENYGFLKFRGNGNPRTYILCLELLDLSTGIAICTPFEPPWTVYSNTWYHFVVTYDGSEITLYRKRPNPASIEEYSLPENDILVEDEAGENLYFGYSALAHPDKPYFNGMIDEIKIWDQALNYQQVLAEIERVNL